MNTTDAIKIWSIAGSLRKDSWNRKLLESAAALAPDHVEMHVSDLLPEVPFFNEDLTGGNEPAVVQRLRAEVMAADAVVFATPEYNGMAPGVMKNLLDWIAFPLGNCALTEKPVALMGASGSKLGTARAQFSLRPMFVFTRSLVTPSPEVLLAFAHEAFDAAGNLTDPICKERIAGVFATLTQYVQMSRKEELALS